MRRRQRRPHCVGEGPGENALGVRGRQRAVRVRFRRLRVPHLPGLWVESCDVADVSPRVPFRVTEGRDSLARGRDFRRLRVPHLPRQRPI